MEKTNVLTTLVVIVLLLTVVNFYGTYRVANALNTLGTGAVVQGGGNDIPSLGGAAAPPAKVDVSIDDDALLGDEDAKVTIVEFSDYQCPFCRAFWRNTLPQIKSEYVDTGKVRLVYRDFPLSFHPAAQPSAEAAQCAGEQGKYWEMHDKIFEEQDKQGQGTVEYGIPELKQWAAELGVDAAKFNACVDSRKYQKEVQADFNAGVGYGVDGTPGFFVNGKKIVGAQPFSVFQQLIEAEL